MKRTLKLVTLYDATRNEYTLLRHNLTLDEVGEAVRELSARLCVLFVLDQHTKHSAAAPDDCPACRKDVGKRAYVQPKPSFKRRQQ